MLSWLPFLAVLACAAGVFAGNWLGEQVPLQRGLLSLVIGAMIFAMVLTGGAVPASDLMALANGETGHFASRFTIFVIAIAALSGASMALRFEGRREQIVGTVVSAVIGLPLLIWFSAVMGMGRMMVV